MEYKDFPLMVKSVDESGVIEARIASYNNVDLDNDVFEYGAFAKTLQERERFPVLWQHDSREPIGYTMQAREEDDGVYATAQLILDVTRAKEAYSLIKSGVPLSASVGFDIIKQQWDGEIRRIKEVRLWEWSIVTFPANPRAAILGVKGVVPYQDLPLADRDRPWDAAKARRNVAVWASSDGSGDKDKIDWAKYRKAFCWYNEEEPENFGSYLLPIADVIDGRLMAVPRGIFAAAVYLDRANIPEEDKERIRRNQLGRYYRKMGLTPPWERDAMVLEFVGKARELVKVFLEDEELAFLKPESKFELERALEKLQALTRLKEPPGGTLDGSKPLEELLDRAIQNLKAIGGAN
ncbi:HK97 family phage prohead protease [Atrimonas thermophila]|uniref:HK97 family phage prohead protease n=1 Tax=Atrimonas thermophila TaxID=3064161 RepID=UPI00399D4308